MVDDPTTAQVLAELSEPAPTDALSLSRRRFLQAAVVTAGTAAMAPSWLGQISEAAPLGADQGVLVVVLLAGGNDGLNTVVPTGTGAYYDRRGSLGIAPSAALPIGAGTGLHPNLRRLKARYDAGKVAVLRGVGDRDPDLSHFEAMARWMSGARTPGPSGWVGRYLDGIGGDDPFTAVAVGTSIPLTAIGRHRRATALPTALSGAFGIVPDDMPPDARVVEAVRAFGAGPTGLGTWGDALAASGRGTVDLAQSVQPLYSPALASGRLAEQLDLCARVVNADLGARVLHVVQGDFDSHAGQASMHGARMDELDVGIERFFTALDPRFADRVTLLTVSEFGRRLQANGSGGTDHGTASTLFAVGNRVRGGLHGEQPSLTSLDRNGNPVVGTDFRAVYATVLDRWLGADSVEVLGANHADLGFILPPGTPQAPPSTTTTVVVPPPTTSTTAPPATSSTTVPAPTTTTTAPSPTTTTPPRPTGGYWLVSRDGAVQAFGGRAGLGGPGKARAVVVGLAPTPTRQGYWTLRANGAVAAFGDAVARGSVSASPSQPVVGLAATPSGGGYWVLGRDGRVSGFGDASPAGAALRPAKPAVGITAVPTGGGAWVLAADGAVLAVGAAPLLGSPDPARLGRAATAIAATPTGRGYWVVSAAGTVFAFGDAGAYGSVKAKLLNPVVAILATASGRGYWLVAADGTVWAKGDAVAHGSFTGGGRPRVAAVA